MLRSETLFGKREPNTPNSTMTGNTNTGSSLTSNNPNVPRQIPATSSLSSTIPGSPTPSAPLPVATTSEVGSKLIVGPNIKLKGVEITDCDTLVVEGRVEATMNSRVIQIAESGVFKGSAEVDIAEIHGEFEGELIARQKLVIYATGKVSGKIRYGKIVIEEGGQLSGDVQVDVQDSPAVARNLSNLTVAKAV